MFTYIMGSGLRLQRGLLSSGARCRRYDGPEIAGERHARGTLRLPRTRYRHAASPPRAVQACQVNCARSAARRAPPGPGGTAALCAPRPFTRRATLFDRLHISGTDSEILQRKPW